MDTNPVPLKPVVPEHNTAADLLLYYLEAMGVEYVFGIPGGAIEPLFDALARSERRDSVQAVVSRHEAGSAFMADGYASASGKIGVCCATTGPGATNLVTGVASAYANHVPMLVITAQTNLSDFGRAAFQESSCTGINTVALLEQCTRYSTLVSHIDQFERKLVTALMEAMGSPKGPVHLSIPLDVFKAPVEHFQPKYDIKSLLERPRLIDQESVLLCSHVLSSSKKTVFVLGEGALTCVEEALKLADTLNADILTLPNAKGLISPFHPRFRGVVGFGGHNSARHILADEALESVVCIGAHLGEWTSNGWDAKLILNERLIHIDDQVSNFACTPMANLQVQGELETVLSQLMILLRKKVVDLPKAVPDQMKRQFELDNEPAFEADTTPIKPQRLMHELVKVFPPATRYIADTGNSLAWAIHYLHPFDRRFRGPRSYGCVLFRGCLEFASMGWAIGHVVGDALADPKRPHVCITGDGSWLMSGQEITVAVEMQLPIIFIVLNDAALGMVKHGQRLAKAEQIGVEITTVDFAAMAQAMGANGITIHSPEEFSNLNAKELLAAKGPTLIDVHIDREEIPPIQMRINTLKGKQA